VEILESSGKVLGCVICKEIVKRLDQFLTSPTFMENVATGIRSTVCPLLVAKSQAECITLFKDYTDDIIENTVYQYLTADEICPAIGIENCSEGPTINESSFP